MIYNMEDVECPLCCFYYDLDSRIPLELGCGHCYCKACLNEMFQKHYMIECPLDRRTFRLNAVETDLGKAMNKIEHIWTITRPCTDHPEKIAYYFNRNNLKFRCEGICKPKDKITALIEAKKDKDIISIIIHRIGDILFSKSENQPIVNPQISNEAFREFKKSIDKSDISVEDCLNTHSLISTYTSSEFKCQIHPSEDAVYYTEDEGNRRFICKNCATNCVKICKASIIRRKLLKSIYFEHSTFNLRSFFLLPRKEILKNKYALIYESNKQNQQKNQRLNRPKLSTRCAMCQEYFDNGVHLPVKLPCENVEHYICYTCHCQYGQYCVLHKKEYSRSKAIFIREDWLDNETFECNCEENHLFSENSKVFTFPCGHLVCETWYNEGILECKKCDVKYGDIKLEEATSFYAYRNNTSLFCHMHNKKATKVEYGRRKAICDQCPSSDEAINLNHRSIKDLRKRMTIRIKNQMERWPEDLDLISLENNMVVLSLSQLLDLFSQFNEIVSNHPEISPGILRYKDASIERFKKVLPSDPTHIYKAWEIGRNQHEVIHLFSSELVYISKLLIGGSVSGESTQAMVRVFDSHGNMIVSQFCMFKGERFNVEFFYPFEMRNYYCIMVSYPERDKIYNGVQRYQQICNAGVSFEIKRQIESDHCGRNDIGGPILGWTFKEVKFEFL